MDNILRKLVLDHSESAFRLSSESYLLKPTAQPGPQWSQMTKFQQIYISFRFRRMSFTVNICQIVTWHKYDLSISRIFEFCFWRVFDIWLHRVAPELRLRVHRPLLQIKITLAQHSRTNSVHPKRSLIFRREC